MCKYTAVAPRPPHYPPPRPTCASGGHCPTFRVDLGIYGTATGVQLTYIGGTRRVFGGAGNWIVTRGQARGWGATLRTLSTVGHYNIQMRFLVVIFLFRTRLHSLVASGIVTMYIVRGGEQCSLVGRPIVTMYIVRGGEQCMVRHVNGSSCEETLAEVAPFQPGQYSHLVAYPGVSEGQN